MARTMILSDAELKKLTPAFFATKGTNYTLFSTVIKPIYIKIVGKEFYIAKFNSEKKAYTLGNVAYKPENKKNVYFGKRIKELTALMSEKANTTIAHQFIIYYACYIGYQNSDLVCTINRYFANNGKRFDNESLLKKSCELEASINTVFEKIQALGLDIKNPIFDLKAVDTTLPFFEFIKQLYAIIGIHSVPHLAKCIAYSYTGKWLQNEDWDYYLNLGNKKQL